MKSDRFRQSYSSRTWLNVLISQKYPLSMAMQLLL